MILAFGFCTFQEVMQLRGHPVVLVAHPPAEVSQIDQEAKRVSIGFILKDRGCGRAPTPCAGAMALARLVGARKEIHVIRVISLGPG